MITRLIKNEEDYDKALSRIEQLMDAKPDTAEMDELELVTALVEMYEERHFPISRPDPIDAIKFRMEQLGLGQKDMVPFIGTKSKVSEVLNKKRPLTLSMMRGLHKGLGIPAEVLLKEPGGQFPNTRPDVEWSRFPLREMAKRGWVTAVNGMRERAEEVMRPFVEAAGGFDALSAPLFRQGIAGRLNAKADPYSVSAWCMRVSALALKNPSGTPFQKKNLTLSTLKDIARLSYFQNGPLLAREYLAKQGIQLIVVPHLSKTYLDGGSMLLPDGNALVALTLRHDRLDNFWFTLLHELAHLSLHLSEKCRLIVDDLDLRGQNGDHEDDTENEADEMASAALIPKSYWPELDAEKAPKTADVISWADKLKIHPALIAGRIRFKQNNYRLFSKLVGRGQVRKLFTEYAQETAT
ncbi:MAG: transcriptional regulator [Candidatus Latescibacteria bacterium 4484_107]|nr:MAG: transcriptional regulator [Candidatus Latescibacteria bacterium 4484_107]